MSTATGAVLALWSGPAQAEEIYLNLVLEYVPDTVYRVCRMYQKAGETTPMIYVKLFVYQLARSLAYIHGLGICHRDIKPQNLLVDHETGVLKLCDFGSAKRLVKDEPNVSYICSRYYRAPELIFGATNYSTAIDVWSSGCVFGEMLLGTPLFPGENRVDQLVEIIKVRGHSGQAEWTKWDPRTRTRTMRETLHRTQSLRRSWAHPLGSRS